jgi:uncharacterized protein
LYAKINGRAVDALLANAGRGLGKAFLDQDFTAVRRVVDTNVTGTIYLIYKVGRDMQVRGKGRILITGSIAGFMPRHLSGCLQWDQSISRFIFLCASRRTERHGVTVTCLMPGATETDFFERADMLDTKVGTQKKDDPAEVAKTGFEAMMAGKGDVVTGWLQSAIALIMPSGLLAEQHRKEAAPGTATD